MGGSAYMELGDELLAHFSLYPPKLYRRAAFFEQFLLFILVLYKLRIIIQLQYTLYTLRDTVRSTAHYFRPSQQTVALTDTTASLKGGFNYPCYFPGSSHGSLSALEFD
jgi:glucan phosphoethanolaminetransferase (alkaline phosphatase superfamily)